MKTPAEYQEFWISLDNLLLKMRSLHINLRVTLNRLLKANCEIKTIHESILVTYLTHPDPEIQRITRLVVHLRILKQCQILHSLATWMFNAEQLANPLPTYITVLHYNMLSNAESFEHLFKIMALSKQQLILHYDIGYINGADQSLNLKVIKRLAEVIRVANISKLKLSWDDRLVTLKEAPKKQVFSQLCKLIQVETISELDINIELLINDQRIMFLQAIKTSNIQSLTLYARKHWYDAIRTFLKTSNIQFLKLNASDAGFTERDFNNALIADGIAGIQQGLNKITWRLSSATPSVIDSLIRMVQQQNFTRSDNLDLTECTLTADLHNLLNAISESKIEHLSVSLTDLHLIESTLINNLSIISIDGIQDIANANCIAAMHRNRELKAIKNKLSSLTQQVLQRETFPSDEFIAHIEKNIAEALDTLTSWSTLTLTQVWSVGCKALISLLHPLVQTLFDHHGIKIDAILPFISAQDNPSFYFEYFNHTIQDYIASFQSDNPGIKNLPRGILQQAFLQGLPYSLDTQCELIHFAVQQQKIFDAYLESAATDSTSSNAPLLSNHERLILFMTLLKEIIKSRGILNDAQFKLADRIRLRECLRDTSNQESGAREFIQVAQVLFKNPDSELFYLIQYMQKLSARIDDEKTIVKAYLENKDKTYRELTDLFVTLANKLFDVHGNLQRYSCEYLMIFDSFLLAIIFKPTENLTAPLNDSQRLFLLQYLVLRECGEINSTLFKQNFSIDKIFSIISDLANLAQQKWLEFTTDAQPLDPPTENNTRIWRFIHASQQFAKRIAEDQEAQQRELERILWVSPLKAIDFEPVMTQQVTVLRQVSRIILMTISNTSAVTQSTRLEGLRDRIENTLNAVPDHHELTSMQKNEISNLWDAMYKRLSELKLNENDDEQNELFQTIQRVQNALVKKATQNSSFFTPADYSPLSSDQIMPASSNATKLPCFR